LLETAWILRSVYAYPVVPLTKAIRAFGGLPTVTLEDAALAAEALDWADGGIDIADALHLSNARHCNEFVTFDHGFAHTAKKLGIPKVRTP
jgi:predicted nucleic acid-binding protein